MCGIIGIVSKRNVASLLVGGLKRLEYRGYDSAGVAIINPEHNIEVVRAVGKVVNLENILKSSPVKGQVGIAHTRWATHGEPTENNAHPHTSNLIAIVHNGIIENHHELRSFLQDNGYKFNSDTDTEVAAHLINYYFEQEQDLLKGIRLAANDFEGAYAFGIISNKNPNEIYTICQGSPLVIGIGIDENFISSDAVAISQNVESVIYLEEDDIAIISEERIYIYDANDQRTSRKIQQISQDEMTVSKKGKFKHYMLKEIFDQTEAIKNTLDGRFSNNKIVLESFGYNIKEVLNKTKSIYIIACGTSYHAGLIAKYWIESVADIPCSVEIASEFRYRDVSIFSDTLFITVSQSGETADTIAALKKSRTMPFLFRLAICNVANSTLVRESDGRILTRAGSEIGVASTKGFTTQLTALLLLSMAFASLKNGENLLTEQDISDLIIAIEHVLSEIDVIKGISADFENNHSALFLGRGSYYPLALEGALKLKEISYIHAESYAAGELKHGPLALVDKEMPILFIAPDNKLLKKIRSNIDEVHSRGGKIYIFTNNSELCKDQRFKVVPMPTVKEMLNPILYSIPLQLLAYEVAVLKGTDVDQPRNLAKSVTVE